MSWIELRENGRRIGRFDLPDTLPGPDGTIFRLYRAVRQGGNGVVFEARQESGADGLVQTCAVKFLKERGETRVDRFNNEVRVLESLTSPRISAAFGKGEVRLGTHDVPWVAMELGAANLRDHIDRNGPLARNVLIPVLLQIVDALEHMHEYGFIHRDIKPANFVWETGGSSDVLMIDFGLAKRLGEDVSARPLDSFTRHMEFVGPVFFSSPELIAYASNKLTPVDHRSDLFQFGKVAWFLGTGTISAGVPSRRLCPAGGGLWDIVMELIADDPEERPTDAEAVRELLLPLASE